MKRLVLIIGWIVFISTVPGFAQSVSAFEPAFAEAEVQAAEARTRAELNWQLAEVQTPFPFSTTSSNREPTAALQTGLQGTWWRESRWIQTLGLTPEQQKRMDDAFRQNKIKLIDLTATLEKAELLLEPLVENIHPGDEAKILAQIDDVANARAELEKTNARMLLSIRQVLTQDQWEKLPKNKNAFGQIRLRTSPNPPTPPTPPPAPAPAAPSEKK